MHHNHCTTMSVLHTYTQYMDTPSTAERIRGVLDQLRYAVNKLKHFHYCGYMVHVYTCFYPYMVVKETVALIACGRHGNHKNVDTH